MALDYTATAIATKRWRRLHLPEVHDDGVDDARAAQIGLVSIAAPRRQVRRVPHVPQAMLNYEIAPALASRWPQMARHRRSELRRLPVRIVEVSVLARRGAYAGEVIRIESETWARTLDGALAGDEDDVGRHHPRSTNWCTGTCRAATKARQRLESRHHHQVIAAALPPAQPTTGDIDLIDVYEANGS